MLKALRVIDFCRANKVFQRQAIDLVGAVADAATVIAHQQLGVVVLLVGNLGDDVYKGHGLVIIIKGIAVTDASVGAVELPLWCQLRQQLCNFFATQGSESAVKDVTLLLTEFVHRLAQKQGYQNL